jgi:hypothetical protein
MWSRRYGTYPVILLHPEVLNLEQLYCDNHRSSTVEPCWRKILYWCSSSISYVKIWQCRPCTFWIVSLNKISQILSGLALNHAWLGINPVEPHVQVSGCVDYSFSVVWVRLCWERKPGDSSIVRKAPKISSYRNSLPYWDHVMSSKKAIFCLKQFLTKVASEGSMCRWEL